VLQSTPQCLCDTDKGPYRACHFDMWVDHMSFDVLQNIVPACTLFAHVVCSVVVIHSNTVWVLHIQYRQIQISIYHRVWVSIQDLVLNL
jgi:hypothetical protein